MLSNTAVPKYYGEFRDMVLGGEIPVCKEISLEMNRIDDLIENPGMYYDEDAVEGWIAFCEEELTLTDGGDLTLLLSFKVWGECVWGWYFFEEKEIYVPNKRKKGGHFELRTVKRRLILKQYLIVGRGAAKSLYLSTNQAYGLTIDTDTTHQITCAPTMNQAEEVLSPIRTAIAISRGPFFQFMTEGSIQNTTGSKANRVKLSPTKKGIENLLTQSLLEIRPMAINKLQGLRPKYSTVDEWLSVEIREDPIGAIEQGASKLDDYLIIATSSEGTIRNGVGDTMKMELLDILKGEYINPRVSIWYYKLDSIDEVAYPDLWPKANPNIGYTVSYDAVQADVERAEKAPSTRNDIFAKRFDIPLEGYTYFFTFEETIRHRKKSYTGMPCSLGADLSRGDDFCAFTFLFPLSNGAFGIKTRSYISQTTFDNLTEALKRKYEQFEAEGTLIVMPGTVLDIKLIYEDIMQHIFQNEYDPQCFGYDPYNADVFVQLWEMENGPYGIEKVIQGARTESVPLGEIKSMSEQGILIFDEDIMSFTMGNCVVSEDTNGNRKLIKRRSDQKIDNVAALLDAYVAYKLHKNLFE